MMKMILTGATLLISVSLFSQNDSTTKGSLLISGSVDAYYRYNFNNAKDGGHTNNYSSFTNTQNSFELGMASLKADYTIGKVEAVADLGFGKRAEEFSYNDQGAMTVIKQAYVSYAPSEKIRFTMGKWATHVGYELLDAYLNRNYSMDYMFSYGPFFHTGIKADVTLNSHVGFMVGVANPTDMVTASFAKKYFLAQLHLATTSGKVNGYLNYVGGKDETDGTSNQFDAVVSGTVTDKFSVGYNGTVKTYKPSGGSSNAWWGSAVYLNYDPTTLFGLTLRGEYFGDDKGVAGLNSNLFDVTLSGNIRLDNLTIIPEIRMDSSRDPLFYKNADTGSPTAKGTGTFILAATYHF